VSSLKGKVPNSIEPRSCLASRHVSALFLLQCSLNPSTGARIVPSATGRAPTLRPWQTSKLENRISIDFPPNVRSSSPKQGKHRKTYQNVLTRVAFAYKFQVCTQSMMMDRVFRNMLRGSDKIQLYSYNKTNEMH